MSWSFDDLFLICITGRGSVLLFNNAGEPMIAATHGLGIELGPSYLLPVNPLIEPSRQVLQILRYRFGLQPFPKVFVTRCN